MHVKRRWKLTRWEKALRRVSKATPGGGYGRAASSLLWAFQDKSATELTRRGRTPVVQWQRLDPTLIIWNTHRQVK